MKTVLSLIAIVAGLYSGAAQARVSVVAECKSNEASVVVRTASLKESQDLNTGYVVQYEIDYPRENEVVGTSMNVAMEIKNVILNRVPSVGKPTRFTLVYADEPEDETYIDIENGGKYAVLVNMGRTHVLGCYAK